jgi:hypothetical protein
MDRITTLSNKGEDDKKSFWTSMPGILTGVAAVIVAIGGILATLHIGYPPSSSPATHNTPPNTTSIPAIQKTSTNPLPEACGTNLLGINIFGKWKWLGTNNGATQSGITTFKNDCTYTNVATAGLTVNSNGHFNISSTPTTIKLHNNFGKDQAYLVDKILENSFHAYDLNNVINLDFMRMS